MLHQFYKQGVMIHAVKGLREVKCADTDRRTIFNKLFYNISNTVDSVSTAQQGSFKIQTDDQML